MNKLSMKILTWMWGEPGSRLPPEEREVSDSIRRLKTLKVNNGHMSIDPSEVVTEAYIQDRRDARRLLSR